MVAIADQRCRLAEVEPPDDGVRAREDRATPAGHPGHRVLHRLALPSNIGAMFAGQIPGSPVSHVLDPIIDNGTVQLGINPEGHLNVEGGVPSSAGPTSGPTSVVGLRYVPTNAESTAPGCLCEGWGVSDGDEEAGTFSGWANRNEVAGTPPLPVRGVHNLILQEAKVTNKKGHTAPLSVGSAFRSVVTTSNGQLRITHDYHPSSSPNLYEVDVTIENIGETSIGDLRYRRVMDWDIEPTAFNEYVEIHVGDAANLARATTDGFQSADPRSNPGPFSGSPPTTLEPGDTDYFSPDGDADQGSLFDFTFGELPVGATRGFKIYYGAASTRTEALAALATVGAEVYSFGFPNSTRTLFRIVTRHERPQRVHLRVRWPRWHARERSAGGRRQGGDDGTRHSSARHAEWK